MIWFTLAWQKNSDAIIEEIKACIEKPTGFGGYCLQLSPLKMWQKLLDQSKNKACGLECEAAR